VTLYGGDLVKCPQAQALAESVREVIIERWTAAGGSWGKVAVGMELEWASDMARDPLMFQTWFNAEDKENYDSIYSQFLMVLRTAPGDRISSYMYTRPAQV
jgi:hypothetical protein